MSYDSPKVVTLITGKIVEDYIRRKAKAIERRVKNLKINVLAIENRYFGEQITVTGLITGTDIIRTIQELREKKEEIGSYLVLPRVMLKDDEDIFLDDTKLSELQKKINLPIVVSDGSATSFIEATLISPKRKITKIGDTGSRQSYENSIQ